MRPNWKTSPTGQRIWATFQKGWKGTIKELAQFTHCHKVTAGEYVRQMREENLIYIFGWVRSRRGHAASQWCLGNKPDAPQLDPLTNAEISSRYFENLCKRIGYDRARMIKNAMRRGATELVLEGKVVWRRGEGVKSHGNTSHLSNNS